MKSIHEEIKWCKHQITWKSPFTDFRFIFEKRSNISASLMELCFVLFQSFYSNIHLFNTFLRFTFEDFSWIQIVSGLKFCKNNKNNQKRRSILLFLTFVSMGPTKPRISQLQIAIVKSSKTSFLIFGILVNKNLNRMTFNQQICMTVMHGFKISN